MVSEGLRRWVKLRPDSADGGWPQPTPNRCHAPDTRHMPFCSPDSRTHQHATAHGGADSEPGGDLCGSERWSDLGRCKPPPPCPGPFEGRHFASYV